MKGETIRIVTDIASDITASEASQMNIQLVLLPVTFEEIEYNQEQDEDYSEFYRLLAKSKTLPKTSQVTPAQYLDIFLDAKEKNESVLVITLSSGQSGTYNSAQMAKEMSEYENIAVIDSRQATISQRMLVDYAVRLRDKGKGLHEIAESLKAVRDRVTVCGVIDTLTYLKMGGRIPPALALIGNVMHIKPIIILRDKKLEMLGKAKGLNKGIQYLYDEYEKGERDTDWPVYFGYTGDKEKGEGFMSQTITRYNLSNTHLFPIGSVIGTHLGPGCIAISFVRKQ